LERYTESKYPHEREALEYLLEGLPDSDPVARAGEGIWSAAATSRAASARLRALWAARLSNQMAVLAPFDRVFRSSESFAAS
jgi:hypothetical protein